MVTTVNNSTPMCLKHTNIYFLSLSTYLYMWQIQGLWIYLEKKGQAKVSEFSIVDVKEWNDEIKQQRSKTNVQNTNTTTSKDCTDPDPKQHRKQ